MKNGKITLVGAGPGDAELITLKGIKALGKADVVLYDALVNMELLGYAPPCAQTIYVGKRANKHAFTQDEINYMLVHHALNGNKVVRLKGGDPFVFGRGLEEADYARAFDIQVDVVPGISSAIAVPASQQIPVTYRGMAESFWVVTATTQYGQFTNDLRLAAQSSATIVILMGIKKLSKICQLMQQYGRAKTPIMVVQNGTTKNEKAVVGTVEDIVEKATKAQIGTPGIIVIGEVVSTHADFAQQKASVLAHQSKF